MTWSLSIIALLSYFTHRLKGLLSGPYEATSPSVGVAPSAFSKTVSRGLLQRRGRDNEEGETDDELVSSGEVTEPTHSPSFTSCKPDSVNLPSMFSYKEAHRKSRSPSLPPVKTSPISLELHQPVLDLSFSDASISSVPEDKMVSSENDCLQNELLSSLETDDDCHRSRRRRSISKLSPDHCDTAREIFHEHKRMKLEEPSTAVLDETLTEQSLDLKPSPTDSDLEKKSPFHADSSPEIIDLTQDEDSCEVSDVTVEHLTPAKSTSGSPVLFLPLTPGKEDSQSILLRQSIAFNIDYYS